MSAFWRAMIFGGFDKGSSGSGGGASSEKAPNSVWLENGEVKTNCDFMVVVRMDNDNEENNTFQLVHGDFATAKEKFEMGLPLSGYVMETQGDSTYLSTYQTISAVSLYKSLEEDYEHFSLYCNSGYCYSVLPDNSVVLD